MKEENYYAILDLPKYSPIEIIKLRYKEMVKIHHPDKGGKAESLDKIVYAYEFFKDEARKGEYDRKLKCKYI